MTNMILGAKAKRVVWQLATFNRCTRFFSILIVVGFVSLGMNDVMLNNAVAAPHSIPNPQEESQSNFGSIITAVLKEASQRSGLPISAFEEIIARQKTWPNGCLGIEEPGQICTQALVPGWQIILSDGSQSWVYHTATDGRIRFAGHQET
ncbi:MAG: hypothetical protein GVY04_08425 [Cyanobacteria bacterium]|jgi:hypothetical protein|nr:hypothetical protein [Cyanobacteria bacterium GSL.Bin1]